MLRLNLLKISRQTMLSLIKLLNNSLEEDFFFNKYLK